MARRALLLLALFLASMGLVFCTNGAHAFLGRTWNENGQCLEATIAIDVMDGVEANAGCNVRCLRTRSEPKLLYVTSMCDPNPPSLDVIDPSDATCALALDAFKKGSACGDEGHP